MTSEPKIINRIHELETLEAITNRFRDANSSEVIAEALLLEAIQLMHSPHAAVLLALEDGRLWPRAAHGNLVGATAFTSFSQGPSFDALRTGEILYVDEALHDEDNQDPLSQATPGQGQLYAPIRTSKGDPLGVLVVTRSLEIAFDDQDIRMLGLIVETAAMVLERVRVLEDLKAQIFESQALLEISQLLEGNDQKSVQNALKRVMVLLEADFVTVSEQNAGQVIAQYHVGTLTTPFEQFLRQGTSMQAERDLKLPAQQSFAVSHNDQHPGAPMLRSFGVYTALTHLLAQQPYRRVTAYRSKRPDPWTPAQHRLLNAAAPTLNALITQLERMQALEASYEGALRAIGQALEMRDHETGGHTDRVARMVEQFALALGFNQERVRLVRWGAFLHDIGKFGVPDSILLKPGKLTTQERELMQHHTQNGFDLTLGMPFLPDEARWVVLYHHERWDGSGYPRGLVGKAIPLEARIFAICDVFDALTSVRPYKPALSEAAALEEIMLASDRGHFDPELVRVFVGMFKIGSAGT